MSGYARFLLRLLFDNKVFKNNRYMFFIFIPKFIYCVSLRDFTRFISNPNITVKTKLDAFALNNGQRRWS